MTQQTKFLRGKEMAYGHYGFASYHIEARQDGLLWHQRHVWMRDDGSIDIEDWISTRGSFFADGHFAEVNADQLAAEAAW